MNLSQFSNLGASGERLYDFGVQPVSNRYLKKDASESAPMFPLQLRLCRQSGLVHLEQPFPVSELRPRYDWLTVFEPEDHLDDLAARITKLPGIDRGSLIGGYCFKDDSTLERLRMLGHSRQWRLDPVRDLDVTDDCAGVETYQQALVPERAAEIALRRGKADVLLVRHVLEHAHDLPVFLEAIRELVRPGGYVVWEAPDCERALESGDCTMIWEEHVFYFTAFTFQNLLESAGYSFIHFESVPYPMENSLVAIVRTGRAKTALVSPPGDLLAAEVQRARGFAEKIQLRQRKIREILGRYRNTAQRIAMFGAGHLSVAFLSIMGLTDMLDCVIDDNPSKKGMVMPVGGLEIFGSEALLDRNIRLCLLGLNPHNQPRVIAKHQSFLDNGGIFASIFPAAPMYLEDMP